MIYISNTFRTANYFLYTIGKDCYKLTFTLTKSLLHSLVFSRLRYCNSLFINIPQTLMNKLDSIQRRVVRILFKLKRTDLTISIHSIMAILGLKFRYICKFHLLGITHKTIYMGVPDYLSKGVIIRVTTRPSRKCELMKNICRVSHLCMQMLLSLLLLRTTVTVFPMNYGPYNFVLLLNVDYIYI